MNLELAGETYIMIQMLSQEEKLVAVRKNTNTMNVLEQRIITDGTVKEGNVLKVDSFLNHQMDVALFDWMGQEFQRRFAG